MVIFLGWPMVRLASSKSLAELIQRRSSVKDQIVAIFDLGEKEPVLTTRSLPFAFFEEWSETGQPFLPAT
jgi:hypothetical protein